MSGWTYLFAAVVFEVVGAVAMKMGAGFERLVPVAVSFAAYCAAFSLGIMALKWVDVSVAYAVWSSVAVASVTVVAVIWFGETMTVMRGLSLLLIVVGVVGLRLSST